MLSPHAIFEEIRSNDDAFRLLAGTASKNELQGGWENERIAALTQDPVLAAKILRHGQDETKHGRLFAAFLRRRGLEPVDVPEDADYCMLLERQGIGLSHARLGEDKPLSNEEIIVYLAHSRVTEQRAAEQVAQMLDCFRNDPELKRGLAMVADDEVNHLSYCHEELLRFRALGYGDLIRRTLRRYALAEIHTTREVSLTFVGAVGDILRWPAWKRALLAFGARAIYVYERVWGWRRMVRLAPPERPNALGTPQPAG
ncbi:MAG: ferritin-like domain-containing protein [Burkholderiales bacterium]|nr:ferritin-like domain-containing protein [Betaproteobacteria bacterium]